MKLCDGNQLCLFHASFVGNEFVGNKCCAMPSTMIRFVVEAVVVGVVMMLTGFPCGLLASKLLPLKGDDHRPVMYLSLFLTGLSAHLLFEVLKINLWYCSSGFACSK